MGYVSTCRGLGWVGWVRHDVKGEGRKEGKEGWMWARKKKKESNFSRARAFLECLVYVMYTIVRVTPRTAVAKKDPLTQGEETGTK